jgi:hypothetical protein
MSDQTTAKKTIIDLLRRDFMKLSAATGGTAALLGGMPHFSQMASRVAQSG